MAHIYRLTLLLLLTLCGACVQAEPTRSDGFAYHADVQTSGGVVKFWGGSPEAACAAGGPSYTQSGYGGMAEFEGAMAIIPSSPPRWNCLAKFEREGRHPVRLIFAEARQGAACPVDWWVLDDGSCVEEKPRDCGEHGEDVGGTCVCDTGYEYDPYSKSCKDEDVKRCDDFNRDSFSSFGGGSFLGGPTIRKGSHPSGEECRPHGGGDKGCSIHWNRSMTGGSGEETQTWGSWTQSSGGPCTVDPEGEGDEEDGDQDDDCPPGQFKGTVNGSSYCYIPGRDDDYSTSNSNSSTDTKDLGNGRTQETTKDVTQDTQCSGGECTTTTTTTTTTTIFDAGGNPEGDSVVTTDTEEMTGGIEDYCRRYPEGEICWTSGVGGDGGGARVSGSCSAGFECQGDPIQCAIYKEQHMRGCQLFEPGGTDEETLYAEADGSAGDDLDKGEIAIDTLFNDTDQLTGSCPANPSITILGQTVSIPYNIICEHAYIFRNIIRAVGAVMWLLIVFG